MSNLKPEVIEETNLSIAWGRAYLSLIDRPQRQFAPLILSITGFESGLPLEDLKTRQALDEELLRHTKFSTDVSAMLIFPYRSWMRRGQPSCKDFSDWYLSDLLPRLVARDPRRNLKGTYFERMIAASGSKRSKGSQRLVVTNQLEHIIKIWKRDRLNEKRPRRSALQVSCFDAVKDHTGAAQSGFPCLQQLSFSYDEDRLALTAVYPTQYIFNRAYGNYLGLCQLGLFMARELELKFTRLNCVINHPELGNVNKTALNSLTKVVRASVFESEESDETSWYNDFKLN